MDCPAAGSGIPSSRIRSVAAASPLRCLGRWILVWIAVAACILPCVLFIDHPLALLLRERLGPNRWASRIVHFPELLVAIAFLGVAALGVWRAVSGRLRGGWHAAFVLGIGLCVALAVKTELKLLFGRVPPEAWFRHQSAPLRNFHLLYAGSFPSGHMTMLGVLTPFLWAYAPPWLRLPWLLACAAVGFSLMVMGAHFFTDLIAGALLGVTVGAACRRIARDR